MDDDINEISKSKTISSECKICGAPALYKYFGAICCHACKIFFKRNAQIGLTTFKCNLNGTCEINIYNRHICTFCRLTKCFTSGMQIELIRCPRKYNTTKSITTNQLDFSQISNHSELNVDQRNLLLNLNQYSKEYNILSHIQQFIQEQIHLPIKLRYKIASLNPLFQSIFNGIELFFKLNHNFLSYDCSNLLRYAMENAGNLTLALILREIPLFDYLDLTESILINITKHLSNEIAQDITFIQLGIVMFVFSTTNHTNYSENNFDYLKNVKDILRIQDLYAEITWKYLIYKYDHTQAVICFSYLIKSFLMINRAIIKIHQSEQYQQIIENLNQQVIIHR